MINPSENLTKAINFKNDDAISDSSNSQLNLDPTTLTMSETIKEQQKSILDREENGGADEEDGEDDDENSKLVTVRIIGNPEQNFQHQQIQQTTNKTLRSILRKQKEKRVSTDGYKTVKQTLTLLDDEKEQVGFSFLDDKNDDHVQDHNEKDSDYTGDENDIESNSGYPKNNKNRRREESKNNEHQYSRNYSRHQRGDEFFRTSSPSTSFISPLASSRTETEFTEKGTGTTNDFQQNDHSTHRITCVTFTSEQPTVIRRSSSTPHLSTLDIQPCSSIAYIDMKEDLSNATTPITTATATTTAGTSATLGTDFRPVYVSPLKYRPLVGLSANDSRLLLEKRVSLLGKPLVFHPVQKRSPYYRRTQLLIYNFLERPHGYKAIIYHTLVFLTVFLCLFLSVVVTMPEYESIASNVLLQTEIVVVFWLALELILRVWSAGCRSRYQTFMGRLRFMKKPFCALDFIMIAATVITLCLNSRGGNGVFAASALRGLRFFQILRMLRMDRRGGTWKLLGSVVYAHRQELITTIYIGFLVLIFSSFIMFLVEKDHFVESKVSMVNGTLNSGLITNYIDTDRHKFETFADALWWGIITLCTVGYGDKVPASYLGKLIAAICSFIGISFFALPAGILGSGFALKVQQQQRQKHYKRRKIPAVLLIQNLWRVYAADEKSLSKATWKVHVRPPRPENNNGSNAHSNLHSASFRIRNNQSFLNRVSFRRRTPTRDAATTSPNIATATISTNRTHANSNSKATPGVTVNAMRNCIDTLSDPATFSRTTTNLSPPEGSSSDNEDDHFYYANDVESLTNTHRHAIRFIRKIKYYVARRKFREALRPYDVTDVIEQYSTGNVDMLARMKYLQARLDKVLGASKSSESYESGPSLASRICKIEKQVDGLDLKVDKLCHLAGTLLERFIEQEKNHPPAIPQPPSPIIINRIRTGTRWHVYRRRRLNRPQSSSSSTITPTKPSPSDINSAITNELQSELPETTTTITIPMPSSITASTTREHSTDSLISLYCLFQDHLNSSRTYNV